MNKLLKLSNTDALFESTVVGGGRVSEHLNGDISVECMTVDGCDVLAVYNSSDAMYQKYRKCHIFNLNTSIDALHHVRQTGFRQRMNREYYGYFEG